MGDENPIHTLGDYSKPSHKGYKNTIELPIGNNVSTKFYPVTPNPDITLFPPKAQSQVQIFYDRIGHTLKRTMDYAVGGQLRKLSAEKAWSTIEELARYEEEGWNDPVDPN
ncbi:hypothetical protein Tco_1541503 [Tanacetum coccineum]